MDLSQLLVVLSVLALAVVGRMPNSQAGWVTCPPQVMALRGWRRWRCDHLGGGGNDHGAACRLCLFRTWYIPLLRSLLAVQEEDGSYTATICGHFTLHVAGDHPFPGRLLMLFLRLLEVSTEQRGSRRTRDGRTPFVRQQYLAQVLGMPQPDISRIEEYWLEGDWPNLLSLKTSEVLTGELMARIVVVFATFPW